MLKYVLAGTTALAIAGGTLAYAQQGPRKPDAQSHWRPSAEDVVAFSDARIAALKAGLKLTAEQEKNWPAVESALRELAKKRADHVAARANAEPEKDPIERLSRRAEFMQENGAGLKKLADAAGPLYRSLDDSQKRRFAMLSHMGGRQGGPGGRHERGWHHGQRGEGGPGWHRGFHGQGGPEMGPRGG